MDFVNRDQIYVHIFQKLTHLAHAVLIGNRSDKMAQTVFNGDNLESAHSAE